MTLDDQLDKLVAQRAADWYEAICRGRENWNSAEFLRWLTEASKHADAFLVVAAQAALLRTAFESPRFNAQALLERDAGEPVPLPVEPMGMNSVNTFYPSASRPERKHRRWMGAAAAGLAATALLLVLIAMHTGYFLWQTLATATGEQRTVALTDGSLVKLNTQSAVQVRLRERSRDIRLIRGEAIFKVARDKARPFRVFTSNAVVEAVGTEFAVSARAEGTTVTVLEGQVKVIPSQPRKDSGANHSELVMVASAATPLTAGQEASIERGGTVRLEPKADVSMSVAWLQRRIQFEHALLEDMVREVNRYNEVVHLRIDGVTPGAYRFSGTFDASDPRSLADLLAREPGLKVERRGDDFVIREVAGGHGTGHE